LEKISEISIILLFEELVSKGLDTPLFIDSLVEEESDVGVEKRGRVVSFSW
jgi:hypothetical protein